MQTFKRYISILVLSLVLFTNTFASYPAAFAAKPIANAIKQEVKQEAKEEKKNDKKEVKLQGREKTELIVKFKDDSVPSEKMNDHEFAVAFSMDQKSGKGKRDHDEVLDEVKDKLKLDKLEKKESKNKIDIDYSQSNSSMMMDTVQPLLTNIALEEMVSDFEVLKIDESDNIQEVIEELESYEEVEFAQPNYKLSIFEAVQIEQTNNVETTTGTMQEIIDLEDEEIKEETTEEIESEVTEEPIVEEAIQIETDNLVETTTSTMQFQISDPLAEQQWGHHNVGQEIQGTIGVEGVDINLLKAWDVTKGNPDIIVGILDTGIDINHEDLANNIYVNTNEIPNNNIDDDGNGYVDDVNGWDFFSADKSVYDNATSDKHGTHIAGIIAAEENGIGIVGVAPKSRILPLKFIEGDVGYTSDAIEAIKYAEHMGVKIINCSFGASDYNYALADAIENSSMLFVCAAGNNGGENVSVYPANYSFGNVVSASALTNEAVISASSNYGTTVDIAAPGKDIYSLNPENSYGFSSGTSQASAYASGVVALVKANREELTNKQLAELIKNNARSYDALTNKVSSNGILDSYGAITGEVSNIEIPIDPSSSISEMLGKVEKLSQLQTSELETLSILLQTTSGIILSFETFEYSIQEIDIIFNETYRNNMKLESTKNIIELADDHSVVAQRLTEYRKAFLYKNLSFKSEEQLVQYIAGSQNLENVSKAFIVASALNLSLDNLIRGEGIELTIDGTEDGAYIELIEEYYIAESVIRAYKQQSNKTWKEILEIVKAYVSDREIKYEPYSSSFDDFGVNFENEFNSPFSVNNSSNENIDILTGELDYTIPLFELQGKNGSLPIGLRYNSGDSNTNLHRPNPSFFDVHTPAYSVRLKALELSYKYQFRDDNGDLTNEYLIQDVYGPIDNDRLRYMYDDRIRNRPLPENCVEQYGNFDGDYFYNYDDRPFLSYPNLRNNLGYGWQLTLPSMERIPDHVMNDEQRDGITFVVHLGDGRKIIAKKWYTSLSHTERINLKNSEYPEYEMEIVPSGEFSNGEIDAHYVLKHIDGTKIYFGGVGRLIGIVDTFENAYKFRHTIYNEGTPYKIAVVDEMVDQYGNITNINHTSNQGDNVATITLPDSSNIKLNVSNFILQNMVDPKGRVTTFDFEKNAAKAKYNRTADYDVEEVWDPIQRRMTYDYEIEEVSREYTVNYNLLKKITFPTDATTSFDYTKGTRLNGATKPYSGANPYEEYYQVSKRYDSAGTKTLNENSYVYEDYSGRQYYMYEELPWDFENQTIHTNSEGLKNIITFNHKHLPIKEEVFDNGQLINRTETEFDTSKNPEKVKTRLFDVNGESNELTKLYQYNQYDQLLSFTNEDGVTQNYAYHNDNIAMIASETVPTDSGKTLSINYTLSSDNLYNESKEIMYKEVDGSSRTLKVMTPRNSNGTVSSEKTYLDGTLLSQKNYSYDYDLTNSDGKRINRITISADNTNNNIVNGVVSDTTEEVKVIFEFDKLTGNLIKQIDPLGKIERYTYDNLGRLSTVVNVDDTQKSLSYDDRYNILIATDEDGFKSKIEYDGLGNELRAYAGYTNDQNILVWDKLSEKTYDNMSRVKTASDALSNTTSFDYDILGRTVKTTLPDGENLSVDYKDVDFKVETTNEEGHTVTETFDKLGNKIETLTTDGNGNTLKSTFAYDYVGNLKSSTDPKGQTTQYTYDELSRLIKVVNPLNETSKYYYDHLGNMTKQAYPDGKTQLNTFNELGQLLSNTDMYGETQYTSYNLDGTVAKLLDRKGEEQSFSYDDKLRIATHTGTDFGFTYQYHNNDRLKSVDQTGYGVTNYAYHLDGKLFSKTTPDSKSTEYTYDLNGNIDTLKDPFGLLVDYDYTSRNQVDTIKANGKTFNYGYYDDGMISSLNYPTATPVSTSFNYDNVNRLEAITSNGLTQSSNFSYTYDNNSNIKTITGIDGNHSYGYDVLNRLTDIDQVTFDKQTSFTYDTLGNRASATGSIGQLIPTTEAEYSWNALNQLTAFKNTDTNQTSTYAYDHTGIRTKKVTPTETTNYYTDEAGRVLAEADANGNAKAQIIWGHKPLARIINNQWYFYIYNGHGDVVQIVDEAGTVVNRYSYDEFGNIIAQTETIENPIKYAGEFYDEESGHYYLRARYYDPVTARFISRDTYGGTLDNPLSHNLYTYCFNNPLVFVDPSGHVPEWA